VDLGDAHGLGEGVDLLGTIPRQKDDALDAVACADVTEEATRVWARLVFESEDTGKRELGVRSVGGLGENDALEAGSDRWEAIAEVRRKFVAAGYHEVVAVDESGESLARMFGDVSDVQQR
jgi:hypothetical protein